MDKVEKVFKAYHFYSLLSYSVVKNRKVTTISSTEHYPIMMWDEGDQKKIYQPLSPNKDRRFMYYGKRDKDFLHGLDVANRKWKEVCEPPKEDITSETDGDDEKRAEKLEEIILCTGGSDAMNVAMMGYQVVWGNPETMLLTVKQFRELSKIAFKVMNLPDIDQTGKREAHRLALEYLEIYTITLPDSLSERKDKRNNPCKDVKDYLKYSNRIDFKKLLDDALPYQFWSVEYIPKRSGKGYKASYVVKNTRLYNFLTKNGFFRLELDNEKLGYVYIRIEGNIVRQVKSNEVKAFINLFFKERMMDEELRDTFYKSTQLNEISLSNLDIIEIDFTDFDKETQYFFYNNRTIEVSCKEIKQYKPGEIKPPKDIPSYIPLKF
jgi:hypothetical protein